MNKLRLSLLYGIYISLAIGTPGVVEPPLSIWLNVFWSVSFIWTFAALTRRRPYAPVAVVLFFTLVAPISILVLIGLPSYGSLIKSLTALFSFMREHGSLADFEIAMPFFSASAAALLARARYNTTIDRDADCARHL
jgi:hypothetical protein